MLIKILEPDFIHSDPRGTLTQLVHQGFSQVNVILSHEHTFRGGHYHKKNKEAFYVIKGSLNLEVELNGSKENYNFSDGDMFLIPNNVVHSFNFSKETLLVSMYDIGVESSNGEKDIFQKE